MSSPPCPLCESTATALRVVGQDRLVATPHDYEYFHCKSCRALFQHPLPTDAEIPGLYPPGYTPHTPPKHRRPRGAVGRFVRTHHLSAETAGRSKLKAGLAKLLAGHSMRRYRAPRGGNRFLDIGCGAGNLVMGYADLGWDAVGVELSEEAARIAQEAGLNVHQGFVQDAGLAPASFDRIALDNVIEHVREPEELLAFAKTLLAPDGELEVMTPNADAWSFEIFEGAWFPLEAPRHLILFTPASLTALAEKVGLEVVELETRGEPRRVCQSLHYDRAMGKQLPADLAERERVIAAAADERHYKLVRKLIGPWSKWQARKGRGEAIVCLLRHKG